MTAFNKHICKPVIEAIRMVCYGQWLKQLVATTLYRNALYLMLNNAIIALFGFFFWIVVARFYSETEVGLGSATISAINLLVLLSMAGLNFSLIRFLPQSEKPGKMINSSFTLSGLIGLASAAIFIAGIDFWSPTLGFIKQDVIFSLALLVIVLLSSLSQLMDSAFVARRRAGFVLAKNTIASALKVPLPIILASFFHTFGIVASWGVAIGIALAISFSLFLPRVQHGYRPVPAIDPGYIKGIWRYSGGSYTASLLAMAPTMILPLMVVNLLGTETNAYFYVAWMIANSLSAIPWSVSQSLFAEGSHSSEDFKDKVVKSIKFIILLLIPAVIVVMISARWLLLAFGPSYSDNALKLLWLLSLSIVPRMIVEVYSAVLRVQYMLKELMLIRVFTASAVLIMSFFAMQAYCIIGIGYAWLGTQGLICLYVVPRLVARLKSLHSFPGSN